MLILLAAGCGGGSEMVADDPASDALDGLQECLSEALDSVRAPTAPREEEEQEEEKPAPLPAALASVVAAASEVVAATAGKPREAEAKAILSAAQQLQNQAKGGAPAGEIQRGLEALRSQVAALEAKP
jgi:hypothetical protein